MQSAEKAIGPHRAAYYALDKSASPDEIFRAKIRMILEIDPNVDFNGNPLPRRLLCAKPNEIPARE